MVSYYATRCLKKLLYIKSLKGVMLYPNDNASTRHVVTNIKPGTWNESFVFKGSEKTH